MLGVPKSNEIEPNRAHLALPAFGSADGRGLHLVLHSLTINVFWPVATLLDDRRCVDVAFLQLDKGLEMAEGAVHDNNALASPNRFCHAKDETPNFAELSLMGRCGERRWTVLAFYELYTKDDLRCSTRDRVILVAKGMWTLSVNGGWSWMLNTSLEAGISVSRM